MSHIGFSLLDILNSFDEMEVLKSGVTGEGPAEEILLSPADAEKDLPDFKLSSVTPEFLISLADYAAEELVWVLKKKSPEEVPVISAVQKAFIRELENKMSDLSEISELRKVSFRIFASQIASGVIKDMSESELCAAKGISNIYLAQRLNLLLGSIMEKLYRSSLLGL